MLKNLKKGLSVLLVATTICAPLTAFANETDATIGFEFGQIELNPDQDLNDAQIWHDIKAYDGLDFGLNEIKLDTTKYLSYSSSRNDNTKLVGAIIENKSKSNAELKVSISDFKIGEESSLAGAELRLMMGMNGISQISGANSANFLDVNLESNQTPTTIMTVPSLTKAGGAWEGELKIFAGTQSTTQEGEYQATMTWTAVAGV